jgi:hypothetical protein
MSINEASKVRLLLFLIACFTFIGINSVEAFDEAACYDCKHASSDSEGNDTCYDVCHDPEPDVAEAPASAPASSTVAPAPGLVAERGCPDICNNHLESAQRECLQTRCAGAPLKKTRQATAGSVNACSSAHSSAKTNCNARNYSAGIDQKLKEFAASKANGNMKAACKAAENISIATGTTNGILGFRCNSASGNCISTCQNTISDLQYEISLAEQAYDYASVVRIEREITEANRHIAECQQEKGGAGAIIAQGIVDVQNYFQAKQCSNLVNAFETRTAPDCSDAKAYEDKNCPMQYCANPKHMREADCGYLAYCGEQQNQNTLTCYCLGKTDDPKCVGAPLPPLPTNTLQAKSPFGTVPSNKFGSSKPTFDVDDDGDDQLLQEQAGAPVKGASADYQDNKGGGLGNLGSLGGGLGGNGKGKGEGPYNTDIYKGQGGGGGGGFAGYGGGGGGSGYGGGRGSGEDKDKMDWRKYMPKLDGDKRKPANVNPALFDAGITAANGLSNFEKVTRKMNEKRPVLLP